LSSFAQTNVGDPCYQTVKHLAVDVKCANPTPTPSGPTLNMRVVVPPGSDSELVVPLLGSPVQSVVLTEGGTAFFRNGAFLPTVSGITGAVVVGNAVVVRHGSGSYSFVRSG
jgi:hypothetical protein